MRESGSNIIEDCLFNRKNYNRGQANGMGIEGGKTDRLGPLIRKNYSNHDGSRSSISPSQNISVTNYLKREPEIIVMHPQHTKQSISTSAKYKQQRNLTLNETGSSQNTSGTIRRIQKNVHNKSNYETHKISPGRYETDRTNFSSNGSHSMQYSENHRNFNNKKIVENSASNSETRKVYLTTDIYNRKNNTSFTEKYDYSPKINTELHQKNDVRTVRHSESKYKLDFFVQPNTSKTTSFENSLSSSKSNIFQKFLRVNPKENIENTNHHKFTSTVQGKSVSANLTNQYLNSPIKYSPRDTSKENSVTVPQSDQSHDLLVKKPNLSGINKLGNNDQHSEVINDRKLINTINNKKSMNTEITLNDEKKTIDGSKTKKMNHTKNTQNDKNQPKNTIDTKILITDNNLSITVEKVNKDKFDAMSRGNSFVSSLKNELSPNDFHQLNKKLSQATLKIPNTNESMGKLESSCNIYKKNYDGNSESEDLNNSQKGYEHKLQKKDLIDESPECCIDHKHGKLKESDKKDEIIQQLQKKIELITKECDETISQQNNMQKIAQTIIASRESDLEKNRSKYNSLKLANKEQSNKLREADEEKHKKSFSKDAEIEHLQNTVDEMRVQLNVIETTKIRNLDFGASEERNIRDDKNKNHFMNFTDQFFQEKQNENTNNDKFNNDIHITVDSYGPHNQYNTDQGIDYEAKYRKLKNKFATLKNIHKKKMSSLNDKLFETKHIKNIYKDNLKDEFAIKPSFASFSK